MLYALLGRVVWSLAKRRVKAKGPGGGPVAGILLTAAGVVAFLLSRRGSAR